MNITQQGIITLLKSAVTGERLPLPEGFSLADANLLIQKQGLITLAFEGATLCGVSKAEPVMGDMLKGYYAVLLRSERQMAKVKALFEQFESAGIDYLPFKGCVMKQLYPKPELRVMGDADVLIRMEQYQQIKPILESLGFTLKIESDCELTWICPDLYLELHRNLVQPVQADFHNYYGNGWSRAVHRENHRYDFSLEDMYVYLFMHFVKHYRFGGIGCRHVVDLWVYRRAYPQMDCHYVNQELEKLNLYQFHENFLRMLDVWFADGQSDSVTDFIAQRIFSGGSWGNADDVKIAVELSKRSTTDNHRHSRIRYALWLLFPPLKHMQNKYPILVRMPVLLPVMWVLRGMNVLLFKRNKVTEVIETGKVITDDAMAAHQQMLRMVGLDL